MLLLALPNFSSNVLKGFGKNMLLFYNYSGISIVRTPMIHSVCVCPYTISGPDFFPSLTLLIFPDTSNVGGS